MISRIIGRGAAAAGSAVAAKAGPALLMGAGILGTIKNAFKSETKSDNTPLPIPDPEIAKTPQEETIRAVDLFTSFKIDPVQIVPELGPEVDENSKHLNLIIERVARLESEVATQNNLIGKLNNAKDNLYDHERKRDLDRKRKESEDKIEKRNRAREFLEYSKGKAEDVGNSPLVQKLLTALGVLGAGLATTALTTERGYTQEFDPDTGIGRGESTLRDVVRVGGAVKGTSIGASGAARTLSTSLGSSKLGAGIQKLSAIGNQFKTNSPKIQDFLNRAAAHGGKLKAFSRNLLRYAAIVVIAAAAFIELISTIKTLYRFFVSGEITEEEFHERNRNQLKRFIGDFGLPIIFAIIGGKMGAALGATLGSVIPFFGNVVAGVVGFVLAAGLGMLAGIAADRIFNMLGGNKLIDKAYDSLMFNEDGEMRAIFSKVANTIERIVNTAEKTKEIGLKVWDYHPLSEPIERSAEFITGRYRDWRGTRQDTRDDIEQLQETNPDTISSLEIDWAPPAKISMWEEELSAARELQASSRHRQRVRGVEMENAIFDEIVEARIMLDDRVSDDQAEELIRAREMTKSSNPRIRDAAIIKIEEIEREIKTSSVEWWQPSWATSEQKEAWDTRYRLAQTLQQNDSAAFVTRGERIERELRTEISRHESIVRNDSVNETHRSEEVTNKPTVTNNVNNNITNNEEWWQPSWATSEQKEAWDTRYRLAQTLQRNNSAEFVTRGERIERELRTEISRHESIVRNDSVNETAITSITNTDIRSSDVQEPSIIPIIIPAQSPRGDAKMSPAQSLPSKTESASPTNRTSDSFVDAGYVT